MMYDCMTAVLWREIFKAKPRCFVMQLSKHDDNVPLITYVSFIFSDQKIYFTLMQIYADGKW